MNDIDVIGLVVSSIYEIIDADRNQNDMALPTIEGSTQLLGKHGILDSNGLVSIIVDIEEKLADEYSLSITIADERAMSQEKSPFLTVNSLGEYISVLIEEQSRNE